MFWFYKAIMGHNPVTGENAIITKNSQHYDYHFRLPTCQELLNKKSDVTMKY